MTTTLPLRVLHADVDVVPAGADSERLLARLGEIWAACRRGDPAPTDRRLPVRLGAPSEDADLDAGASAKDTDEVAGDDLPEVVTDDPDRAPTAVSQALVHAAIESGVSRLLMLHAAGLADPVTGAAVVCVARGGTGKTTLCRTLGAGRRYLTDETVAVHPDGRIVPFPKPLSVRRPGSEVKDEVAPHEAGLSTEGAPPWLAALLLLRRDPDHRGEPTVTELGLFDTVLALCEETSSLDRLDRPLHVLADLLERTRPALAVTYAEAESLRPLVEGLIGPAEAPGGAP